MGSQQRGYILSGKVLSVAFASVNDLYAHQNCKVLQATLKKVYLTWNIPDDLNVFYVTNGLIIKLYVYDEALK